MRQFWSLFSKNHQIIMPKYNPEEKHLDIVLIGNFNPRIFQPQWFSNHNIISASDHNYIIENDNVLIHKQITQFKSSWFRLEITETRMHISCTQEAYFEAIIDLLFATFTVLSHTPVSQFGINLTIIQKFDHTEDSEKFEKDYFPTNALSKLDANVTTFNTKSALNNGNIKIGKSCQIEFSKQQILNSYLININQHFELDLNSDGAEFIKIFGKEARNAVGASEFVLKSIIENK